MCIFHPYTNTRVDMLFHISMCVHEEKGTHAHVCLVCTGTHVPPAQTQLHMCTYKCRHGQTCCVIALVDASKGQTPMHTQQTCMLPPSSLLELWRYVEALHRSGPAFGMRQMQCSPFLLDSAEHGSPVQSHPALPNHFLLCGPLSLPFLVSKMGLMIWAPIHQGLCELTK